MQALIYLFQKKQLWKRKRKFSKANLACVELLPHSSTGKTGSPLTSEKRPTDRQYEMYIAPKIQELHIW